ncbi:hypothetical protein FSW04_03155 [Baekduia soli]|uniref:Uncharacterized protein n=1 Tax=Baekduia soli TaxID=496014 RepID=A0A5B8U107_9ACTN|nr:hypothetical protein [Baekduia soli]QEC46678.1 hypothetical protein FSW04_03155 [Baekduia soli]
MRSVVLCVLPALVAVAVGCGGGSSGRTDTAQQALQLGRPGSAWRALTPAQQLDAVKDCRLGAAVAASTASGSGPAFFSDRYRAIQRLQESTLTTALDRWFAAAGHAGQSLQEGCTAVAERLADIPSVARRPHVEFALPVTGGKGPLGLEVAGPDIELVGRVSPSGARVTLSRPGDRARSTATWRIDQRGDTVRVSLRSIPLGVSYLRVDVAGPGVRRAGRLLVIDRSHAPSRRPPRTFAPVLLRGTTSRTLSVLYIPRAARATVRSDGPVTLTASGSLLVAHRPGPTTTATIRPALYHDVRIAAAGPWVLRIEPVGAAQGGGGP